MNTPLSLLLVLLTLGLYACESGPGSPKGFSLPEGDIAMGETTFLKYQCLACHTIEGIEYESINKVFEQPVRLGGNSSIVKTYAQLVTSIINPSHKLAPRSINLEIVVTEDGLSKMPVFNEVMTITELINIVAFLQPKYKVKPMQYTQYHHYHIP
jgi:mono/diheme cytochrome c family protein